MEPKNIYDYVSYREVLKSRLNSAAGAQRGGKAALARILNVQPSYVTRVWNGEADLSLEQGEVLARHWTFSLAESNFFLLLLQNERAGSQGLRQHFERLIKEERGKQLLLRERIKERSKLTLEQQARYYSSWRYAALHILCSIPRFQAVVTAAAALGIPRSACQRVFTDLTAMGLVRQDGERYVMTEARIHVPGDSPLITQHHRNWRVRVMEALDQSADDVITGEDLHYTSVVSVSVADVAKLKTRMIKLIEEYNAVVSPSKEEELMVFCLDFQSMAVDSCR